MSTRARLGVVLAAVVVLVVGFVVLGDSNDGSPSSSAADVVATGTDTGATTAAPATGGATAPSTTTTQAPEASAAPEETTISVRDGQARGGVDELKFDKGERVRFRVTSDAADEIHVHGFDIEEEVAPGKPAEFSFPADIEGVFDVEIHSSDTQIATLEVEP